jgi:hypothetical protein
METSFKQVEEQLKLNRRKKRIESLNRQQEKNDKETEDISNKYLTIIKDFTILAGTTFGSSIALSTGRPQNDLFILGEFFLLVSVLSGAVKLWSEIKGREWFYFLMVKGRLQFDLNLNADIMEDFERKEVQKLIDSYARLMSKKGSIWYLLKIIPVDYFPTISFSTFTIGVFFICLSLVTSVKIFPILIQMIYLTFNLLNEVLFIVWLINWFL